jgi:Helix-turn-helix domain
VRGGWQLCLLCDGRGWKRRSADDAPWDGYVELPLQEASELPREPTRRRAEPVGEHEPFVWERLRATYDRHGSYGELRRQLDWLSLRSPTRHRLVRSVLVDHEPKLLTAGASRELELGVLQVALRMRTVRVPPWLIERTAADERRDVLAALAADGLRAGEIARRLGITREAAKRKLRALERVDFALRPEPRKAA